MAEEYIHFIAEHACPKAMSEQEVERESAGDPYTMTVHERHFLRCDVIFESYTYEKGGIIVYCIVTHSQVYLADLLCVFPRIPWERLRRTRS